MASTRAELKTLSNNTFFDNDQGQIAPLEHRAFNNELIDFIIQMCATFVVDSDEALAAWANNTEGNDYTSVLIKPGTWTSDKEVNLTTAGTKVVRGMPGSLLSFTSECGLRYDDRLDSLEYQIHNVNVEVNNSISYDITCFYKCINLVDCKGICMGGNNGSTNNEYKNIYSSPFYSCKNLTNCTGHGYNSAGAPQLCFRNCTDLIGCVGYGKGFGAGLSMFSDCENLTNCSAVFDINSSGSGSSTGFSSCKNLINCSGVGRYAFSGCRIMTFCKPGATPSTTGTYINCYMHATGTADPVDDTAAGGWNRS
jgi:hypothetical protein